MCLMSRLKTGSNPFEKEHQGGCGDCGDQQRDDRRYGDVEHQNLQDEDDTRNGGFEYGGEGSCCTATEQQGDVFVVEPHEAPDIRSDGSARIDDRSLRTDRSAESDRSRTGDDRRIAVVRFDARTLFAHRIKHPRHTLVDVSRGRRIGRKVWRG